MPGAVCRRALVVASLVLGGCHGATSEVHYTCTVEEEGETGGVEVVVYSEDSMTCEQYCYQGDQVLGSEEAHCEGATPDSAPTRDCTCFYDDIPRACVRWLGGRVCND